MASRKLDINKATVDQFEQLTGIGRTKAEAIVNYRQKLGSFSGISDLQKVTGIGEAIMNQLRPVVKCCRLKVLNRSNVRKQTQRITRSVASAQLSIQPDETEPPSGDTCHHSPSAPLPRRYCTRSNSKSNGFEKRNLTLWQKRITAKSRRHSIRLRNASNVVASEPSEIAPGKQICAIKNLSIEVAEAVEDNSRGSVNTESSSSENAFGSASTTTTRSSQNLPSCSKSQDIFPNAQNFEGRRFANRATPSSSGTQNSDPLADPCSRLVGYENGEGRDLVASEESAHGSGSQQISNSVHDDSGISMQYRVPVTCDGNEKPSAKRKAEANEDDRLSKKLCVDDDCAVQLSEDINGGGLPNGSVGEIQQMSPRKQKIPSKKNPPVLLDGWLKTFQNWSHAERLLALDELMETCDPTEVRHVMQVIEPQFQRDFISLLPKELALYVLSFLEPNDLLRAAQTCRYWHMLAEDNILWREKCHEEGISEILVFGNFARRKRPASKSPWKSLYLRQQQIEQNWRTSNRPPKVLKGHDDHVITCLEFNGTKIVSGSDDNTLKVWSAVTGKCLRTLTGHTGGVWSSQMSGNIIVSGSTDRTLKVWDADTGRTIYTLYGHTSTVRCMHLYNNRVVSGSRDATLRMWDIETGHCLHVLIGHMAAVRCVQYDGRRVVSGAYDYMVKIWDPEKETCLQTLAGHTNRVYSLQFDGVHIVSGSLDTSIRVWSAETGACLHTLVGHQSLTSGMELKDNILVSGNADSTVKVWNITTGQCLQTLNGPNKHQSAVTCLQFNRKLIITSSDDGTIKIWDLKTGEFVRNLVTLESGGSGGVVWRIRCNNSKLVCAVGSRNGTEETKLLVLDFDVDEDNSNNKSALPTS